MEGLGTWTPRAAALDGHCDTFQELLDTPAVSALFEHARTAKHKHCNRQHYDEWNKGVEQLGHCQLTLRLIGDVRREGSPRSAVSKITQAPSSKHIPRRPNTTATVDKDAAK